MRMKIVDAILLRTTALRASSGHLREGQAMYCAAHEILGADALKEICGDSSIDPFHIDENIPVFLKWVVENYS